MNIHCVRTITLIILLLPISLHGAENFDIWFQKNKKFFEAKDKENIPDLFQEPQHEPATLTSAGIRYLMLTFPLETQLEIVKHLIPSIPSFVIGVHENEITKVETKSHSYTPYLEFQNNKTHMIIKCACCIDENTPQQDSVVFAGCRSQTINNTTGLYLTTPKTLKHNCTLMSVWNTVQKVSLPKTLTFLSFNPDTACIHSGYSRKTQLHADIMPAHVITWQLPAITQNHSYYSLCIKNKDRLNLYKVLMLLDQAHYSKNPLLGGLSQKTQTILTHLKKQLEHTNAATIIQKSISIKKNQKEKK